MLWAQENFNARFADPEQMTALSGHDHLPSPLLLPVNQGFPELRLVALVEMQLGFVDQDERSGPPAVQEFSHEENDLLLTATQFGEIVDGSAFCLDDQFPMIPLQSLPSLEKPIEGFRVCLEAIGFLVSAFFLGVQVFPSDSV